MTTGEGRCASAGRDPGAVLVTGGAGYVGSHVVPAFREAGYRVVVLDDLSTGRRAAVPDDVAFVEGDAGDPETAAAAIAGHGVASVVHLAASLDIAESLADPLKYDRNNARASASLVRAWVAGGVERFLFASSAAVYGRPGAAPVGEDAPARPVNPYGRSKLATEGLLRETAARHGMRYAALRYFNVAGADPAGRAMPAACGASGQGGLRGRGGTAQWRHRQRHRLRHAGWDLRARLHPRRRPGRHPCRGAPRPGERGAEPGTQLRVRPRVLGPRSDRRGAGGSGRRPDSPRRSPPPRRPAGRRRRYPAPARRRALVAAPRRPRRDRSQRARLGEKTQPQNTRFPDPEGSENGKPDLKSAARTADREWPRPARRSGSLERPGWVLAWVRRHPSAANAVWAAANNLQQTGCSN